jgi:predicted ATPase
LRAATSLARLLRDQGSSVDALALLQPVYDRFTEGFETADLKVAKTLLEVLAEPAGLLGGALDRLIKPTSHSHDSRNP